MIEMENLGDSFRFTNEAKTLSGLKKLKLFFRKDSYWLFKSRFERMDANLFFCGPQKRREFHNDRYLFATKTLSDYRGSGPILDVACGLGYGTRILADTLKTSVVGADINKDAIAYAARAYGNKYCSFKTGDVLNETIFESEAFDAIISFETIEHLSEPLVFLENASRWLKKNGTLIISTPNNWECSRYHRFRYTYDLFINHIGKHFSINKIYVQNSGSMKIKYNCRQHRRLVPADAGNIESAEIFIAVSNKNSGRSD